MIRRSSLLFGVAAAVVGLAAQTPAAFAAGSSPTATPAAASTAGASSAASSSASARQVSYLGRTFTVPSSWSVVNLAANPEACVRLNVDAVYLGTPGTRQSCPDRAAGRADAVVLEPGSATAAASATQSTIDQEITAQAPGIEANAYYGTAGSAAVTKVLNSGGLAATVTANAGATRRAAAAPAALSGSATTFTGEAFDTCEDPSASTLSSWSGSPFRAVGMYIGGANMTCTQPNLTASALASEASAGWHFYPLYVGVQGAGNTCGCSVMTSPVSQADAAAQDAVNIASGLGFGPGSPIFYDMETYSSAGTANVIAFESEWTKELHALGYASGVYGSIDPEMNDIVDNIGSMTVPDDIDFAHWNGDVSTSDSDIPSGDWVNHQRIHQYSGAVDLTYGGVEVQVDEDYMDISPLPSTASPVQDISTFSTGNGSLYSMADENGTLYEVIQNLTTGGWNNVSPGIKVSGGLTSWYDAANNSTYTLADEGGTLYEVIQNMTTGAWSNTSPGIDVSGQLASFVTGNGSLYILADENGTLYEVIQNLTTGTWSNTSPGIPVSGGISAWYDSAKSSTYIMLDEGGTLYEAIQNMTTGAWSNDSPGIEASGELSTFSTGNGSLYTMVDEGGTLYEVIQNLTTGTWSNTSPAIPATGGISTWYDAAKSSTYTMVDESGTLYEVIQNMTTGTWSNTSPGISL